MAHKLLCFAALISMAALAAGATTSSEDTAALLLPGSTGSNQCVYTLYVETGSIWKAGTDAAIGVELYTAAGNGILIRNLQAWGGLMGNGHDYFERSNVDIFSGRGPCLGAPVCRMKLTSNGAGEHHGWFCNSVEVTVAGPHARCTRAAFNVQQWLATDAPPYHLYAERSVCGRITTTPPAAAAAVEKEN
uniref:PLAT domain-containing protein n=1 Tax=Oryza brachyantha TaxID=4533 RepID=J3LYH6_ORYBR